MGKYALYGRDRIKVGTCEDMYYLRASQAWLVRRDCGSLDPRDESIPLRFRFPFPDEDDVRPGDFEDYKRKLGIPDDVSRELGLVAPEHSLVQFHHPHGYFINAPCPESPEGRALREPGGAVRLWANGVGARFGIEQQKRVPGGELRVVLCCMACESAFSLDRDEGLALASALRKLGHVWKQIADRIGAGYDGTTVDGWERRSEAPVLALVKKARARR